MKPMLQTPAASKPAAITSELTAAESEQDVPQVIHPHACPPHSHALTDTHSERRLVIPDPTSYPYLPIFLDCFSLFGCSGSSFADSWLLSVPEQISIKAACVLCLSFFPPYCKATVLTTMPLCNFLINFDLR